MKPHLFFLFAFLSFAQVGWTQQNQEMRARKADIEAQKVSFITSELELTPQQAQDFWPLYNAYRSELQKLRKSVNQIYNPGRDADKDLSEKEWDEIIKREFAFERQKTDLEEKYYELYKTVLPVSKVAGFYTAERDFKRELLETLKEKRGQQRMR